jgi:hypothetical protein
MSRLKPTALDTLPRWWAGTWSGIVAESADKVALKPSCAMHQPTRTAARGDQGSDGQAGCARGTAAICRSAHAQVREAADLAELSRWTGMER